ncbi:MAG: hypothetical protein LBT46_12725 [Planctomycetaceae bacterium]|jgi:adenosylhomocysteine nucleosidase|nr:hypothetical protein [Planctomycetaceae bacterium]
MSADRISSRPDTGFIFAMPIESAGIVSRLTYRKTTKGNGHTFHTGIFADRRVVLIEAGVGQKAARNAAAVLCDVFEPKSLCSAGYAGGLTERFKKLTLCIPQQVIRLCDGAALDLTSSIPQRADVPNAGLLTLLTADEPVSAPDAKQQLGRQFAAELVDMETFAVADVCRERQLPFLPVRIILDAVNEPLMSGVLPIQNSAKHGFIYLAGTLVRMIGKRPSMIFDLWKLHQDAVKATEKLTKQIAGELRKTPRREQGGGR